VATTSPSTTTTISIVTRTLAGVTATILVVVIVRRSCRQEAAETSAAAMRETVLRNCHREAVELVGMPGIVLRNFPPMQGVIGNTIHHIAVALHIGTGQPQIDLVAPREAIHSPGVRQVRANRSGAKAATCPASGPAEVPALAIALEALEMGPVVVASATGAAVEDLAAPDLAAARTVLEVAISHARAVEIAMPSAGETGDSTDRVRAETAVADLPVLALEAAEASAAAVEAAEVVVDGVDKARSGLDENGIPGAQNEITICECKSVPDGLHSRR